MNDYAKFIACLRCDDDASENPLVIQSSALMGSKDELTESGVIFESTAEGVIVDLSEQPVKVFKSKKDAFNYLGPGDFTNDIVILDMQNGHGTAFLADEGFESADCFFENTAFFHKLKSSFVNWGVASFYDELNKKLIFLSSKNGRLDILCENIWVDDFFDKNWGLSAISNQLDRCGEEGHGFFDFFRENCMEVAKISPSSERVFFDILMHLERVLELTIRDHALYKNSFSFADFKEQLDEQKRKYLSDYQASLSGMLSKIASMPVQFGVYLYLIVRFESERFPLFAITLLIFAWSFFTVVTVNRLLENLSYLKKKFVEDHDRLLFESGLPRSDLAFYEDEIEEGFKKSTNLARKYRVFVVMFSACAIAICIYLLWTPQVLELLAFVMAQLESHSY